MDTYLFVGVVRPERATLTMPPIGMRFKHLTSGRTAEARISIVLNQVTAWMECEDEWDVYDLRNVVKSVVQQRLSLVGFLKGLAFDLEITRVVNQARAIDFVFGIDIPCLAERGRTVDLDRRIAEVQPLLLGDLGVHIDRCFSDLVSAMKHADDTGFYCYRAIESLRHHCAATHDLAGAGKSEQWKKLRDVAGCDESVTRKIEASAKSLRHGEVAPLTSDDRATLLMTTWDVVDAYLSRCHVVHVVHSP